MVYAIYLRKPTLQKPCGFFGPSAFSPKIFKIIIVTLKGGEIKINKQNN